MCICAEYSTSALKPGVSSALCGSLTDRNDTNITLSVCLNIVVHSGKLSCLCSNISVRRLVYPASFPDKAPHVLVRLDDTRLQSSICALQSGHTEFVECTTELHVQAGQHAYTQNGVLHGVFSLAIGLCFEQQV